MADPSSMDYMRRATDALTTATDPTSTLTITQRDRAVQIAQTQALLALASEIQLLNYNAMMRQQ